MYKRKAIKGFELYDIDTNGCIWSAWRQKRVCGRIKSYISKGKKPLGESLNTQGYACAMLYKEDGTKKRVLAHRLVLEAFVGNCPQGMECCHNNGIRNDNKLSNLRWDTPKGNQSDRRLHGTNNTAFPMSTVGEGNVRSKLNEHQVKRIRLIAEVSPSLRQNKIASMFGVTSPNISFILKRKTWKHI